MRYGTGVCGIYGVGSLFPPAEINISVLTSAGNPEPDYRLAICGNGRIRRP
jgi:hypothetical protein